MQNTVCFRDLPGEVAGNVELERFLIVLGRRLSLLACCGIEMVSVQGFAWHVGMLSPVGLSVTLRVDDSFSLVTGVRSLNLPTLLGGLVPRRLFFLIFH